MGLDNSTPRKIELELLLESDKKNVKARLELASIWWKIGFPEIAVDHATRAFNHLEYAIRQELIVGDRNSVSDVYNVATEEAGAIPFLNESGLGSHARILLECSEYLTILRKSEPRNFDWKSLMEFFNNQTKAEDLHIALKQITFHVSEIDHESIKFLSEIANGDSFDPHDTLDAVRWYNRTGKDIDAENRFHYFKRVGRYHTEFNLIDGYWRSGSFDDLKFGISARFDYVLGMEYQSLSLEDKAKAILKRNALKDRLGRERYEMMIRQIANPTTLTKADPSVTNRLNSYLQFYDALGDLPVHESKVSVLSRNPSYIVNIDIGEQKVITFVKLYDKKIPGFRKTAQYELEILESLSDRDLQVPLSISLVDLNNYRLNFMTFINGDNLYNTLNTGIESTKKMHYFTKAIEQLIVIQNCVPQIISKKGSNLEQLTELSEFFVERIQNTMRKYVDENLSSRLYAHMKPLIRYLVEESKKHGVYFKDSNPRNVMVSPDYVCHVDFEYGLLAIGELDLAKLLRNGLDFSTFDSSHDYTTLDKVSQTRFEESRQKAKSYVTSLRYLSPGEEANLVKLYNHVPGGDIVPESQKRYDFSSLFMHIYYVAWLSKNLHEAGNNKKVIDNRRKYHLLEAKVLLDHILHDNITYQVDKSQYKELREDLDLIPC